MAGRRAAPGLGYPDPLAAQRLEVALAPVVRLELLDKTFAEDAEGCEQRVELVQRVLAPCNRVEVELERDPIVAVGQLEKHPRLEVARALGALGVVAAIVALKTTLARVLDVRDDIRTGVEAGQVQEPALVDASAIRQAPLPAPSVICRSCKR